MNRAPDPVLSLAGDALAAALNRLLALDPASAARLRALEGRHVEYLWTTAGRGLRVSVVDGRLRFGPRGADPDLAIASSLAGLLGFLWPAAKAAVPAERARVNVSGDAELARTLADIAAGFAPDVEGDLTRVLGPGYGPAAGALLGRVLRALREGGARGAEDAAQFAREHLSVAREEVEDWAGDVDALRDRVERVAVRIARLAGREDPAP